MPISPEDFLHSAEPIASIEHTEVYVRNAVSRSYYSMYHKVLSILDSEPPRQKGKGCHANLIDYLKSHGKGLERFESKSLVRLSYMLRQQKERRVDADYKLYLYFELRDAKESIKVANKFFKLCEQMNITKKQAS